jgi:hypothetical protein
MHARARTYPHKPLHTEPHVHAQLDILQRCHPPAPSSLPPALPSPTLPRAHKRPLARPPAHAFARSLVRSHSHAHMHAGAHVQWHTHPHPPGHPAAPGRITSAGLGGARTPPESSQLWVLRNTLTLKTTDTTLVSVDGDNGPMGALTHLPSAGPESITEMTPRATVTLTQSLGCGKARPRS